MANVDVRMGMWICNAMQCNEFIPNYKHMSQWGAWRRHNSQQIGLFVFSGVFSSTALSSITDLLSSNSLLSLHAVHTSLSRLVLFREYHWFPSLHSHPPASAPISGSNLMARAACVRLPRQPSQFHSPVLDPSLWVDVWSPATDWGCNSATQRQISLLVVLLFIIGAGANSMFILIIWHSRGSCWIDLAPSCLMEQGFAS